nr:15130_t:CDS:2 [Entrophospora candida]
MSNFQNSQKCPVINDSSINSNSSLPAVPPRPTTTSMNTSIANRRYSPHSNYNSSYNTTYGNSYGGYGSLSPHSRYGSTYSSSPYNGFGVGYGSGGSYGSPYNRFGGMGMMGPPPPGGQFGRPDDMMTTMSLTQRIEANTAAGFQMIESMVNVFGGLAQMLESTYFATHSSFMAMVGVVEQFGNLRNYLGQVLSLSLTDFQQRPLIFFIIAVFGLPYLMHKFIRAFSAATDRPNLEMCQALYDFRGETPIELTFQRGDIIAIMSKVDDTWGQPSQWWKGRLRNGEQGFFPANHVEIINKINKE